MLYLYLGFLFAQSHTVIKVIYNANIPLLTIFFSITVFLIWSLFPVLGYLLGKAVTTYSKTNRHCNRYVLFALGSSISIIEQSLYYFEIYSRKNEYISMLITAAFFFGTAFIYTRRSTEELTFSN